VPNRPNPLYPAYSPSPYIDDAGNLTNDPGTAAAPGAVQVPSAVDIAPPGSAAAPATTTTPTTTTTAGTTAPGLAKTAPIPLTGDPTVDAILQETQNEVDTANGLVSSLFDQSVTTQNHLLELQQQAQQDPNKQFDAAFLADYNRSSQTLNELYRSMGTAESRLGAAAQSRAASLANVVGPRAQAEAENQKAQAGEANQRAAQLAAGAEGARTLTAAQAAQASGAAQLDKANAQKVTAQTQPEIDQINANIAEINQRVNTAKTQQKVFTAQASNIDAQTAAINAKVGPDIAETNSRAALNTANSALATANADAVSKRLPSEIGLTQGQTAAQLGAAAQAQSVAGQNLLGPMYGMQEQLNVLRGIQQQIFGPGGSGTPEERAQQANDMLQQYVQARVAGTTPYAGAVAAGNYGPTQFGTQAAMTNAAQQAAASRANAFAGMGAGVLGTLASMNVNAPAGSTAMAGAFQDVLNNMQQRLGGAQAFAPPAQPTPPPMPRMLQQYLGGPASPGASSPGTLPATTPASSATAPNAGAGSVNINIGTSGTPQSQTPAPFAPPPGGYAPLSQQPGTYGPQTGSMPALLQQYAPLTPQQAVDHLHQLWSSELQSGAVTSPYAGAS
jgi:hypothetical protein